MRDDELERLFRLYHAPLVRYLTRRLGDRDWAEEVAQEAFLRALRQDSLTNERSWLFAVATNLVRDEARRTARQRRHLQVLAEQERDAVKVHLEVRKDSGASGYCTLRSQAESGAEVGRADFRFDGDATRIDRVVTLRTTSPGTTAELLGCHAD